MKYLLILSIMTTTNVFSFELKVKKSVKVVNPTISCSDLKSKDFSSLLGAKVTISEAKEELDSSTNKTYCDVLGKIEPQINFEVKLPVNTWTERFVEVGCGGYCGSLNLRPLENVSTCAPAMNGEIAMAATDMGHGGGMGNATWGNDPQARIDFAYRANHLTAVISKLLMKNYYGQNPKYSYFMGCSDGGREALMEVQRYPEDFDGVTAGASAMNVAEHNTLYHGWNYVSNLGTNGKPILMASKTTLIHNAVLAACDAKDGVKDGVINTPWECRFDVATLLCKNGQDEKTCLTSEELKVAQAIYNGPVDESTKSKLSIGQPLLGSELQWSAFAPESEGQPSFTSSVALQTFKYVVNSEPVDEKFSLTDVKFTEETFDKIAKFHDLYDANSTNISSFNSKGGKLILWHGLNDTDMAPISTVAYYTALENKFGRNKIQDFVKLYLLPGVGHCGRGQGPSNLELLTSIINWVENKKAPFKLTATLTSGGDHPPMGDHAGPPPAGMKMQSTPTTVIRTRPVFPYPITTVYKGMGSTDDEANFTSGKKVPVPQELLEWYGSKFYK
jgi:hypothetical protein